MKNIDVRANDGRVVAPFKWADERLKTDVIAKAVFTVHLATGDCQDTTALECPLFNADVLVLGGSGIFKSEVYTFFDLSGLLAGGIYGLSVRDRIWFGAGAESERGQRRKSKSSHQNSSLDYLAIASGFTAVAVKGTAA